MSSNDMAALLVIVGGATLLVIAFCIAVLGPIVGIYQLNAWRERRKAERSYEKMMSELAEKDFDELVAKAIKAVETKDKAEKAWRKDLWGQPASKGQDGVKGPDGVKGQDAVVSSEEEWQRAMKEDPY